MITWPEKLIRVIAQRRCVLFLGSGVSANSTNVAGERPKTWISVIKTGIDSLPTTITTKQKNVIKKLIKKNDLLMACELLREYMGNDDYKDLLKAEFYDKHFQPAQMHMDIEQLDVRYVVTPNFDQIYESYLRSIPNNDIVVAKFNDSNIADIIRTSHRLIIKSHGDINTADEIIFTKSDYAKARSKYSQFYSVLDALLLTHTFVFIGAGFNDPDIQMMLEDYTYRNQYKRSHYFVTPQDSLSKEEFDVMARNLSLKFITYDKREGHKELIDSIHDLRSKVADMREEISVSKDW